MKYTRLTKEQEQQLLENTIANIESEHYATTLALKRAEVTGDPAQIEQFKKALENLEAQHKALTPEPKK